ncbi:Pentatricopeptide repeat protein [Madurella fahalii]|uniref:Pentatricopeptide repeat protein n=1 Tax=Madurella fahalii TaxID=1157608 RepID=A0ABQ0GSW2_9PEZI
MFVCRACRRSISGVSPSPVESRLLRPVRKSTGLGYGRRTFAATHLTRERYRPDIVDVKAALLAETETETKAPNSHAPQPKKKGPPIPGSKDAKELYKNRLEWVVNKHLTYLKDPVDIAAHVRRALDKGSFEEALLMARRASRNTKVEVSWNHLIDHHMKNHRLHAAIKLYNEMKKRQQVPNARTYTIIFRGCAQSIHPKLAVAEAVRIYNFMVHYGAQKPNTIHMNAVLEVCARAHDLDSMLTVFATANNNLRAPDALTYTIILNSLRHEATKADKGLGLIDTEVKQTIRGHIDRARALWADVIARWRGGKILIDERLVCAMGRLLTLGDYHSNDSVLDLFEQTMRMPRLDKTGNKLPDGAGEVEAAPETQANAESDVAMPKQPSEVEAPDTHNMGPIARRELAASKPAGIYAKPGTNTLSLLMTVLAKTRKTSLASRYWDYFTRVLDVKPDKDNYGRYLKALSVGHASAQTVKLVSEMPAELLNHITFRTAFGVCIQDALNPNAFGHACNIFDIMVAKVRYPDPLTMRLFLHTARNAQASLLRKALKDEARKAEADKSQAETTDAELDTAAAESLTTTDFIKMALAEEAKKKRSAGPVPEAADAKQPPRGAPTPEDREHGRRLMVALDRMWEPFRILLSSFSYPEQPTASPEHEADMKRADMQEAMATGRAMISAIVWILDHDILDPVRERNSIRELKNRQTVLIRLVQRYANKLYNERQEPHDRKGKGEERRDAVRVFDEDDGQASLYA